MSSLLIVQTSKGSPRRLKNQEERSVPFQTPLTGRWSVAPLETRVQAIQLFPSHAGLAESALATAFSPVSALHTCCCSLCLSTSGKCVNPRTFLQVLTHCMGDSKPRDTAHSILNRHPKPFSLPLSVTHITTTLQFQSLTGTPSLSAYRFWLRIQYRASW